MRRRMRNGHEKGGCAALARRHNPASTPRTPTCTPPPARTLHPHLPPATPPALLPAATVPWCHEGAVWVPCREQCPRPNPMTCGPPLYRDGLRDSARLAYPSMFYPPGVTVAPVGCASACAPSRPARTHAERRSAFRAESLQCPPLPPPCAGSGRLGSGGRSEDAPTRRTWLVALVL